MSTNNADVCSHARTLLVEAQRLLQGLVESGEVEEASTAEATLWYLDDAVTMLTPNEDPAPALRLVRNCGGAS